MAATEITQRHGKLYNPTFGARLFSAMTAVTGVAPGTAIGTTAAFALHNPYGSGVNISIITARMGYISGTLGAGSVFHCVNTNNQAAAPTGTAITEIPGIGNGAAGVGTALTTATLAASPTPLYPMCSLQASLATSVTQPWLAKDDVDGAIIIPPGCTYSLEAVAAAGTSPLVVFGVTWEEVPVGVD